MRLHALFEVGMKLCPKFTKIGAESFWSCYVVPIFPDRKKPGMPIRVCRLLKPTAPNLEEKRS